MLLPKLRNMFKKIIFILVIFLLTFFSTKLKAQIIKGEAIMGFNMSQVDGDMFYGFKKFGLQVGAGAIIPFAKNWDVSVEVLYNQKGSRQRAKIYDTLCIYDYKLQLNYAEVPLLVHYTDKNFITAAVGFSWGRLVTANEWENGIKTTTNTKSNTYEINDFNILAGVSIRIKGPLKFNVRYAYSLEPLRTREFTNCDTNAKFTRQQYNNVITFRLQYVLGERRSKENLNAVKSSE